MALAQGPSGRLGSMQEPSAKSHEFPPMYSFPPFYTLQPNLTTRAAQLTQWSSVILGYASSQRLYRIHATHPIFTNATLKRSLSPADARIALLHMVQHNLADPIDSLSQLHTSAAIIANSQLSDEKRRAKSKTREGEGESEVWLWWKTPEEWASLIVEWVDRTGQKGSILTFYELSESAATEREPFHGLPGELLGRIVGVLVRRGKAAVLGEGMAWGSKCGR